MKNIKFLDRFTVFLLVLSLLGVTLGAFLWYKLGVVKSTSDNNARAIGQITNFFSDVRLKRSGTTHWIPVSEGLYFFANDLIFTGDSSFAKLDFTSGESIKVDANSLLSISNEKIQLENGSIDINIQGQSNFKVESFGETLALKNKGNIKIINTDLEKNIISDIQDKKELKEDNQSIQYRKLNLLSPEKFQRFPMLKAVSVTLEWSDNLVTPDNSASYNVDFSLDSNFNDVFYSFKTNQNKVQIKSSKLKTGTVYFKITALDELNNPTIISSQFIMYGETDFQNFSPSNNKNFSLVNGQVQMVFKWSSPLNYNNKLQIAKDSNFTELILDEELIQKQEYDYVFYQNGTYFWRLGYLINNEIAWSNRVLSFSIMSKKNKDKISFFNFSDTYNFTLIDSYTLHLNDPNKAKFHLVRIYSDAKKIREIKISGGKYILEKLETGRYKIKIKSIFDDGTELYSDDLYFNVIDGTPPPAPKIKQKDQDLFVKFLSFIFPTAQASEKVELKWEKNETAVLSEIEIYRNDELFHTSTIDVNTYDLLVTKPGTYSWRVRSKVDGVWSDFSLMKRLYVKDKIIQIDQPLMQDILLDKKNSEVIFKWNEPSREFKYFLEIYDNYKDGSISIIEVNSGMFKTELSQLPRSFRWRVFAKSIHGSVSPNNETRTFSPMNVDIKHVKLEVMSVNSEQKQEINTGSTSLLNRKNNFNGLAYSVSYLDRFYWKTLDLQKNIAVRKIDLVDSSDSYQSFDFMAEVGSTVLIRRTSMHDIFLGFQYSKTNIYFNPGNSYDYNFYFFSSRYEYFTEFSLNHGYKFSAKGLLYVDIDNPRVSLQLRNAYVWKINSRNILSPFLGIERNTIFASGVKGPLSGDLNISNNIFSIGLDFSYAF